MKNLYSVLVVVLFSVVSAWAEDQADLTVFHRTGTEFYKVQYEGDGIRSFSAVMPLSKSSSSLSVFDLQNEAGTFGLSQFKLAKSITPNLDTTINSTIISGGGISNDLGVDVRRGSFGLGIVIPMKSEKAEDVLLGPRFAYGVLTGYLTINGQGRNPMYGLTISKGGLNVDMAYQPNGSISWVRLAKVVNSEVGKIIPQIRVQTNPGCGGRWIGFSLALVPK